MKISKAYIQFRDRNVLLVVTGKQEACVYRAAKGRITKIATLEIPRDVYFDREGFFMHRGKSSLKGGGMVYGTGSMYERSDNEAVRFMRRLKQRLESILSRRKIDEVYLFAPDYFLRIIRAHLPEEARSRLKYSFRGNYTKSHPFELLEKITDRQRKAG